MEERTSTEKDDGMKKKETGVQKQQAPREQIKRLPKRLNHPSMHIIKVSSGPALNHKKNVIFLPPKYQFTAHWSLTLSLIEDEEFDLKNLQIGLFRLGAIENTTQHAIVIKGITNMKRDGSHIWGDINFHAPRTPCDVVLRLFVKDNDAKKSKVDDEEDKLPKHVTTLARSLCIHVKCDCSDNAAEVLRGILGAIKRGLSSPLTNLQNLYATIKSYPCHEHQKLVFGVFNECSKSARSTTNDFNTLCEKIIDLEEKNKNDIESIEENKAEEEKVIVENDDSQLADKSKLQKLYSERASMERRIVEVKSLILTCYLHKVSHLFLLTFVMQ